MIECKICGHEFKPVIKKHYISREKQTSGIVSLAKCTEVKLFDTFDCPACGCQVVAQERMRNCTGKETGGDIEDDR